MDTFRGLQGDEPDDEDRRPDYEPHDDGGAIESPSPVGQDERRMQVRAYNYWASLLGERSYPSIEDLEPAALPDFGPYSVLLDFSVGIEDPAVQYLGDRLAAECGAQGTIRHLHDVPGRSLLSRITDHYMQIIANQAPIGFEAEFVNHRGQSILYRGILLPFSSDDDTIDFIYGVINWKELADQHTTDELMLEIDQALGDPAETAVRRGDALTAWADGPVGEDDVLDLATLAGDEAADAVDWPEPSFGAADVAPPPIAAPGFETSFGGDDDAVPPSEPDFVVAPDAAMALADWLASARELAQAARNSEDRTRTALYAAIGRAYDFALAAADAREEFEELVVDAGLTMQDRAPMTPVVKLVFGADYDKTRLTEYAAALGYAQRLRVPAGTLAAHLAAAPGGLKGVVNEERRFRKQAAGRPVEVREAPREALARKLRKLAPVTLEQVAQDGGEFALLVARRTADGTVVLLGEVPEDVALLERAARKLLG